jgi:hypothetical protein
MVLNYMWYSRFAEIRCKFNLTPHVLVIVSTTLMFWPGTMEICVFDVRCGVICEQRYVLFGDTGQWRTGVGFKPPRNSEVLPKLSRIPVLWNIHP